MNASLVYADERVAVFNKPAGLSLATRRSDPDAAVRRLVESLGREERESAWIDAGPLWLVHRLDVATTGLVLAARDPETHRELSEQLSSRLIQKSYLALVWGHPRPSSGNYTWPIAPDTCDRRRMRADAAGRSALTRYQVLAKAPHVSLVELHPETGRTHQIRVHLAKAGHWIVGDDLYGGARHRGLKGARLQALLNPPHLLLHAWRLELPESSTMSARKFEAPLPHHFKEAIEGLGISDALERR